MFNLFGRKTAKDFIKEAEDAYSVPEVKSVEVPKKEQKEFYRVGRTNDGYTTLTMIGDNGYSMTLTMNQESCEQMIRMLESTFSNEKEGTDELNS